MGWNTGKQTNALGKLLMTQGVCKLANSSLFISFVHWVFLTDRCVAYPENSIYWGTPTEQLDVLCVSAGESVLHFRSGCDRSRGFGSRLRRQAIISAVPSKLVPFKSQAGVCCEHTRTLS